MNGTPNIPKDFFVNHAKEIEGILRRAGEQARWLHKQLGKPIVSWENGQVVIVPPEKIEIDESLLQGNGKSLEVK